MLSSRNYWLGVVSGVAVLYLYNRYQMRRAAS